MDEFLASLSSAQVSEWMAYYTLLAEESQRPQGGGVVQRASGQDALDVLAKHARKRR